MGGWGETREERMENRERMEEKKKREEGGKETEREKERLKIEKEKREVENLRITGKRKNAIQRKRTLNPILSSFD